MMKKVCWLCAVLLCLTICQEASAGIFCGRWFNGRLRNAIFGRARCGASTGCGSAADSRCQGGSCYAPSSAGAADRGSHPYAPTQVLNSPPAAPR